MAVKSPAERTTDWFPAVWGALIALTLFLSGEQAERTGAIHLPALLWLLAVVVQAIWPMLSRRPPSRLRFSRIDVYVYGFFGFVILSLLWNLLPGRGTPRAGINMLSVWIVLTSAWFLCRQMPRDGRIVGALFALLFAVLFAEALTGLHQQFVDFPKMLRRLDADPVGTVRLADPTIEPGTPNWDRMVARLKTVAPMGTYTMSNTLGGLLGAGLVLLIGFLLFPPATTGYPERVHATGNRGEQRGPSNGKPADRAARPEFRATLSRVAQYGLVLALFICFVATKCRSAYVAVAIGLGLLGLAIRQRRFGSNRGTRGGRMRPFLFGIGAVALFGAVVWTTPGKNVLEGARKSLGYRIEYWEASLEMIRESPFFGCGSGNFKQSYTQYKRPGASEEIADPHQFALEIAAVSGLPALLLFFLAVVMSLLGACRRSSETVPDRHDVALHSETSDGIASRASASPVPGRRLFWGGLAGCWTAFLLSFQTEVPMDPIAPAAATFAFVLTAFAFRSFQAAWPISGVVPVVPVCAALVALLVHLSVAGGISVTSTAIVLWLLLAALADRRDGEAVDAEAARVGSKTGRLVVAALGIVGLVLVHHYGLRPVRTAQSLTLQAEESRNVSRRLVLFRKAAEADPWSMTAQERWAAEAFQFWRADPDSRHWKSEVLKAEGRAMRRAPRSASLRFVFAERRNRLYRQTGDTSLRDEALELYREAIERYPNHAKYRAPYALLLRDTGRLDEARRQRDRAVELDDLMHHADQKLSAEQRRELSEPEFRSDR